MTVASASVSPFPPMTDEKNRRGILSGYFDSLASLEGEQSQDDELMMLMLMIMLREGGSRSSDTAGLLLQSAEVNS